MSEKEADQTDGPLWERYQKAVCLTEEDPDGAAAALEQLQHQVAAAALFSAGTESLDDVSSAALPLLCLEHSLAVALVAAPTPPDKAAERLHHLQRACDLWSHFLQRLEQFEQLTREEVEQYHSLLEVSSTATTTDGLPPPSSLPVDREVKIARFKAKKEASEKASKLTALLERRRRLGLSSTEDMDGYDEESALREWALQQLQISKLDAFEEWSSVIRELPMIGRMLEVQQQRREQLDRYGKVSEEKRPELSGKPLQVTHITKDAASGQLHVRREEIQSQVFRPGWNQPTMSLEEFGDREMRAAVEREQRQKEAEQTAAQGPARYSRLVKQGREDDADAVDASAALDRAWDDWKDENPRGSGNKRGDVGDRNF